MGSEITINVILDIKTCHCGAVYAISNWLETYDYKCPVCSMRIQSTMESEKADLQIEIDHLKRVIAGMKGAMKK